MSTARSRGLAVAAAVALLALVLALPLLDGGDEASPSRPAAGAEETRTPAPAAQAVLRSQRLRPAPSCSRDASTPFRPVAIGVPGVAEATALAMPRDANDVPGVAPLTSAGKHAFAWDDDPRSARPGSRHGNVLLNAHTWPDGTALGNQLLTGLQEGELVKLRGADGQVLCYRVTERVEVPADRPYLRYYRDTGDPQLAVLVCSGTRTGPGAWTHRTIWFAEPVAG